MKNILNFLLITGFPAFVSGQNYQAELNKVNAFLKTFDKGYYGYLEVQDGYLYDRFKSGKYTKAAIQELDQASTTETKRKVELFCMDNQDCVFSTYTDSYHSSMSFSQSSDFNTLELESLLNDLVQALQDDNTTPSVNRNAASIKRLKIEILMQKKLASKPVTEKTSSSTPSYGTQLNALNDYLKTFNPEVYGNVSVINGKVYFDFKVGSSKYFASIPVSDLTQETKILKDKPITTEEVRIECKNLADCFYSSYLGGNTNHFRFFSNTVKDLGKMQQLVQDFVNALK